MNCWLERRDVLDFVESSVGFNRCHIAHCGSIPDLSDKCNPKFHIRSESEVQHQRVCIMKFGIRAKESRSSIFARSGSCACLAKLFTQTASTMMCTSCLCHVACCLSLAVEVRQVQRWVEY